ncbi:MAG: carboxypeptidase regulatory-like domain-containing protein [Saprospiraceae bacterium]|nr:carboxypeptidase regulatory-like domain-containing protein [Saprospiraceae bacterium]
MQALRTTSLVLFFLVWACHTLMAQVTTSSITGTVSDDKGESLIGATVKATHVPSGTIYGTVTQENGRYSIPNMRVGGPYTVEASYVGYTLNLQENVFLALGQKFTLNFKMLAEGVTLEGVTVTSERDPVLNGKRTGPATAINRDLLDKLPTISRSAADYTRLNPMASEGGSFAGRNDQFNNYSLDGTIFNNPFGLDAATPGGQTDAQPISLDAIEQISVAIAPYDVTQSGFTGASINAVTKSGTNQFHGTAFGYFRNKDMIGGKVDDTEVVKGDLKQLQTGFSLGGPIIRDKVFFFANLELDRRSDLGSYFVPNNGSNAGDANVSRVLLSDMQLVANLLSQTYGYDVGLLQNFKHDSDNTKGIFKLDFNLNENHKLTASYNFLDAFKDKPAHPSAIGRRGPDFLTLQFQNAGYRINNKIHSGIVELKSFFGSKFANKFQIGYTAFRDSRNPFSEPFPVLNIGKNGTRYIIAGHEPFSINNRLDQDVIQINNNFNIYAGKHTITIGGAFERFNFDNSFNLTGYGLRVFFPDVPIEGIENLIKSADFAKEVSDARAAFDNNNRNNKWALAETNLGQISAYVQDEITMNDQLTMTFGLRVDYPLFFNTADLIQENIERKGGLLSDGGTYDPSIVYSDENGNNVTFDHTILPKNNPLINPRFGFNYDLKGDRSAQLRGGTGLFSGRFPFVWIGNQVANPDFFFYNMTDPDFKFPQVWRTNLGYDQRFGKGWIATVDMLYTKDLQAQMVRNYGLKLPSGTLQGPGSRPIYRLNDRVLVFGSPTNAYVFTNTDAGYTFNTSVSIERNWNNTYIKLGYNYLQAEDAASIDAEISSDAYDRNPANISHTNRPLLAPSLYGNRHRILGAASKKFAYGNDKFGTTISLFFEYLEGGRYSYTYSGDINNDGSGLNDLIYVPTDSEIDQMNFAGDAASQRTKLKQYIAQDEYLSGRRGEFTEKYGALAPWYNHWDLRILQDFYVSESNKLQLSIDVLNVGNLINSGWGVRQFATQTALAQPIAVSVDANGVPTYSFDTAQTQTFFNDFSLLSRWQLQLGLRYEF